MILNKPGQSVIEITLVEIYEVAIAIKGFNKQDGSLKNLRLKLQESFADLSIKRACT